MTRLRWISPLLCLFAGMLSCMGLLLFQSWWGGQENYVGFRVGLNLPKAQEWETSDDHGGFHGDGLRTDKLQFSTQDGDLVEAHIKSRGDLWNEGFFDDYLGDVVYRNGHGATEADWPRYPEHAYWFFKDRHSQQEKALTERHSWNYTAALFDADTDTLYYLEFDT